MKSIYPLGLWSHPARPLQNSPVASRGYILRAGDKAALEGELLNPGHRDTAPTLWPCGRNPGCGERHFGGSSTVKSRKASCAVSQVSAANWCGQHLAQAVANGSWQRASCSSSPQVSSLAGGGDRETGNNQFLLLRGPRRPRFRSCSDDVSVEVQDLYRRQPTYVQTNRSCAQAQTY